MIPRAFSCLLLGTAISPRSVPGLIDHVSDLCYTYPKRISCTHISWKMQKSMKLLTYLTAFLQITSSRAIYRIINSSYCGHPGVLPTILVSPLFLWIHLLIPLLHWNCKVFGAKTRLLFWVWTDFSPMRSQTVTRFLPLLQHQHFNWSPTFDELVFYFPFLLLLS